MQIHLNPTTGTAWVHTQYCSYWCPDAQAPGHQYPQWWLNIHHIVRAWVHAQHCSYWWPGAKAQGHQYQQWWLNIHHIVRAWVHAQHCSYWWPGAKAQGHQYPQWWLNIHHIVRAWVHAQHCSYWWPGAKAQGHQYPQWWLNIHHIGPVAYRDIAVITNYIKNQIMFWEKKILSCLRIDITPKPVSTQRVKSSSHEFSCSSNVTGMYQVSRASFLE